MELILLQKVKNLGVLGDKVKVKPGYGRNYLVPQGKAVPATADNVAQFEQRRAEFEAKANQILSGAEARSGRGNADLFQKPDRFGLGVPSRHVSVAKVERSGAWVSVRVGGKAGLRKAFGPGPQAQRPPRGAGSYTK